MTRHKVGTQEEYEAARAELLKREQELGNLDEEIAKQRAELPWVPVEKEYTFDSEEGPKSLPELFDGRSQLLIYHVMFGPSYAAALSGMHRAGGPPHRGGSAHELPRRDADGHLAGADREAEGVQEADGMGVPLRVVEPQ